LILGVSIAAFFAEVVPLSYVAPGFVQWWIIGKEVPVIWTHGTLYPLANLVSLLGLAVIGPFVEEVFFRGVLLPVWAHRFGPTTGVILSSLVFAVFHPSILGSFIFAVVTAVVLLKSQSLWLPIVIHATNNALAWLFAAAELVFVGESHLTLADLQARWWLGLVGLLVGLPLLIAVLRRIPQPGCDTRTATVV